VELFDVSVPIRPGMVTYPSDPDVRFERVSSIESGDVVNLTRIDLGAHSGTHVDAPVHFLDEGAGIESLPLDALVGPARVVDATGIHGDVGEEALQSLPAGVERVLFKTRNSELWSQETFAEDFAKVSPAAARRLVELGVRLVGIDYLSIGDPEAHRTLLGAGVVAIEGLDLRSVEPGDYELICAPLKLVGSDGAPARVLLRRA
jgi:arylformamidase